MNKLLTIGVIFSLWIAGFCVYAKTSKSSASAIQGPKGLYWSQIDRNGPAPPGIKTQPANPQPTDPELVDVQVPIPKEMRQYNDSGIQCVWCSLQNLCKFHNITAGVDLCKTYKSYASPGGVSRALTSRNIEFVQTTSGKNTAFMREWVTEKKAGVGVGIRGVHMINVVHWDEEKGIVKVIDNQGPYACKIQTWTMAQFMERWDGWAIAIVPSSK